MRFALSYLFLALAGLPGYAQVHDPLIEAKLESLPGVTSYLDSFQSFGVKHPGTQALGETGSWIMEYAQDFGYDAEFDSFQDPLGKWQRNVIVRKPGSIRSAFIVVGAHYDTRNGTGTNDNGSGVVSLMHTLRVLKDHNPLYDLEIVFFSGEEQGFHGSAHYVDSILSMDQRELLLMLNVDQIGGTKGAQGNDKIYCERDENNDPPSNNSASQAITDTLATLTELYSDLTPVISKAFSSDYEPFEDAGEVITGLYQFAPYPNTHSASDSLRYMDTSSFKQAIRVVVAATMYFSGQKALSIATTMGQPVRFYPNPADQVIRVQGLLKTGIAVLYTIDGRSRGQRPLQNGLIDIADLSAGMYIVHIKSGGKLFRGRLVVH